MMRCLPVVDKGGDSVIGGANHESKIPRSSTHHFSGGSSSRNFPVLYSLGKKKTFPAFPGKSQVPHNSQLLTCNQCFGLKDNIQQS